MADTQIPLVLVRNLPISSAVPNADTQVVGVDSTGVTVRIPWTSVSAGFLHSQNVPASATDEGVQNGIAVGQSLYSYYNGAWGKIPRYTNNWEDLDANTRFLLVSKAMTLSETEKGNVWSALGLQIATNAAVGLVKGSGTISIGKDGEAYVNNATATIPGVVCIDGVEEDPLSAASTKYVNAQISALSNKEVIIPIASETTVGGITPSETVSVDAETGEASVHIAEHGKDKPGLVKIAATDKLDETSINAQAEYAAPVALVQSLISAIGDRAQTPATIETRGAVRPSGAIVITDAEAGAIDVRKAGTNTVYGAVSLVDSITDDNAGDNVESGGIAPSPKAVKQYVDNFSPAVNIPVATTGRAGVVMASETLQVQGNGYAVVPTATNGTLGLVILSPVSSTSRDVADNQAACVAYVKDYFAKNATAVSVPAAAAGTAGIVQLQLLPGELTPPTGYFQVPTVAYLGSSDLFATTAKAGDVRIVTDLDTTPDEQDETLGYQVPTLAAVQDLENMHEAHFEVIISWIDTINNKLDTLNNYVKSKHGSYAWQPY